MSSFAMTVLVLFVVIITMGGIIYVFNRERKEQKKRIEELERQLVYAKENVTQLSSYIDKLQKIKADEKTITQKIKEAKSDEEVYSIIASIVSDNNSRVQNNKN